MTYNFHTIEKKWQKVWEEEHLQTKRIAGQILPRNVPLSIRKLHMGHVRNYSIGM